MIKRITRKIRLVFGLWIATLCAMSANANVVFERFDDFTQVSSGWSSNATYVLSGQNILGDFSNQTISLSIALPTHDSVTLAFDFWTINTWDGNGAPYPEGTTASGADRFTTDVIGGPIIVDSSFSNHRYQDFPNNVGEGFNAPLTGAAEVIGTGAEARVRWHFEETFTHSGDLVINFTGSGLQNISDESWGLDNVHVVAETTSVAEPTSLILLGLGILGFVGLRKNEKV